MKFFFDANFSWKLAAAVARIEEGNDIEIIWHDLMYPPNERKAPRDEVWIPEVSKLRPLPFVVSGDNRILTNAVQVEALLQSGMTFFAVNHGFTNLSIYRQCEQFFKCWPEVLSRARANRRPQAYKLLQNGKLEPREITRKNRRK